MDYRKFGNDYVVRIDKNEELLATIKSLCEKEKISLGSINGLGAASKVTLGVFDGVQKKFFSKTFEGAIEIASITGNISKKDGEIYLHIHSAIGNPDTEMVCSGHLSEAVIGLTGEIFIHKIDGEVGRKFSDEIGLNLFEFN